MTDGRSGVGSPVEAGDDGTGTGDDGTGTGDDGWMESSIVPLRS